MIVPLLPSQSWYPKLLRLLVNLPAVIPAKNNLLKMPAKKLHPLREKLTLLARHLFGDSTRTEAFLHTLQVSSSTLGENPRVNNTEHILVSGYYSVLKGVLKRHKVVKRDINPVHPPISMDRTV